jgi:hypothetical protein
MVVPTATVIPETRRRYYFLFVDHPRVIALVENQNSECAPSRAPL